MSAVDLPPRTPPCVLGVEFSAHVAPYRSCEVVEGLLRALGDHPELHLQVRLDPGGFAPQSSSPEAGARACVERLLAHPRVAPLDAADPAGWLDAWLGSVEAYVVPAVTSAFADLHDAAVRRAVPVIAPETVPAARDVRPHFVSDVARGETTVGAIAGAIRAWLEERAGLCAVAA